MLRIEHLNRIYTGGIRALHDISLDIPKGMHGLLAPNGAGKSTLMRTLATRRNPTVAAFTWMNSMSSRIPRHCAANSVICHRNLVPIRAPIVHAPLVQAPRVQAPRVHAPLRRSCLDTSQP